MTRRHTIAFIIVVIVGFRATAQTYNTPSPGVIPSDSELIFIHGFHTTDLVWMLGDQWYVTRFGVTPTPGAVVLRTIYMPEPAMERARRMLTAEINDAHLHAVAALSMAASDVSRRVAQSLAAVTRFRPVQPIPKLCTDMAALGESQSDINTSREWARSMGALMDCRGDLVRLARADSQRRGVDPLQYFADHQLDFHGLMVTHTIAVARDPVWRGYGVASLLYDGRPQVGQVSDPECAEACEVWFQYPLIAARPPVVVGWGK